ncbi:MAG TPA: V-type ATP synthase subunit K [Candidatus Bathyarchaeia archaeon]|nr:V-type ATP synthase subunit K [Candidatus Bathyarchaeia archaeon]
MDPLAVEIGRGLAIAGAGLAVGMGCAGSGKGIGVASQAATGVLSEKPNLFGQILVLVALPGTQGIYGFITAILIFMYSGLINGTYMVAPNTGVALLVLGFGVGLALYTSAVWQGEASAASISLVARRAEEFGRAILFPALVETYAVIALLAGILSIIWLTNQAPGTNILQYIQAVQ